jgi:hypothetical protein
MRTIEREIGAARIASGRFDDAKAIFQRVSTESPLIEFLTLPAYEALRRLERS